MSAQALVPNSTIADLFGHAWNSGRITLNERQYIQSAILANTLSEEDRAAIDRLVHAVRRGWLKLLD